MSYTPVVRWRNFTLDNLKSILSLFPDMLVQTSRKSVVDVIETKLQGYKATAYQFACQAGVEARKENFTQQNYLFALDDNGLEKYLGFWFKMYVCPNPYVKSDEQPICPFLEIAKEVLDSPDSKISFIEFFNKAFGEGQSVDIFKNALVAWGKPLSVRGDDIFVAPENIELLASLVKKVESTLPMKNNKDIDEFFERFSSEKFAKFYDLATIDTYKNKINTQTIFDGFESWLTSFDNPDYTGKEKYAGYSKALEKLVTFMKEKELIEDANLNDLDVEKYKLFERVYETSEEVKTYDKEKLSNKAGIAALKKYIKYIDCLLNPHSDYFDYLYTAGKSENKIFFGVPGCGKSHHVDYDVLGKDKETKKYKGNYDEDNIIRTTFYQDYSNSDFVGQILPKITKGEDGESRVHI